jgi:hypothetical protein
MRVCVYVTPFNPKIQVRQTRRTVGPFLRTHRFTPPVLGIRIKDEITIVSEGQVKDKHEEKDSNGRRPLKPSNGSLTVRGKGKENKQKEDQYLDLLTQNHCRCFSDVYLCLIRSMNPLSDRTNSLARRS